MMLWRDKIRQALLTLCRVAASVLQLVWNAAVALPPAPNKKETVEETPSTISGGSPCTEKLYEMRVIICDGFRVRKKEFPENVPTIEELWISPSMQKRILLNALSHAMPSPCSRNSQQPLPQEYYLVELSAESRGCGKSSIKRSMAAATGSHILAINAEDWSAMIEGVDSLDRMSDILGEAWNRVIDEFVRHSGGGRFILSVDLPFNWVESYDQYAVVVSFLLCHGKDDIISSGAVPIMLLDKQAEKESFMSLLEQDDEPLNGSIHCIPCDKNAIKQIVAMYYGCDAYSYDFTSKENVSMLPRDLIKLVTDHHLNLDELTLILSK